MVRRTRLLYLCVCVRVCESTVRPPLHREIPADFLGGEEDSFFGSGEGGGQSMTPFFSLFFYGSCLAVYEDGGIFFGVDLGRGEGAFTLR